MNAETELELVVTAAAEAAADVRLLELRSPDGAKLPAWSAGAHIDLLLDDGLVRQYSLCSDPADRGRWQVAVLREPESRGGSAHVHDKLSAGDPVKARGPRNHFELEPAAAYVFVAGGIGITPILPMLATADAAGADWRLYYGGRTRGSMAFVDDLVARHGDGVVVCPQDETGLLDLDRIVAGRPAGALLYSCGPAPLLDALETACATLPAGTLRTERFTALKADPDAVSAGFEVELADSGQVLRVPADKSILDVLEEAGIEILSSCREGTCGTCETGVRSGAIDHRDALLTADERAANDVMFVCVSRAAPNCPRLVLDR
ncbi:PDR/VanB family oxidoreductase [Streptomyces melanosporofaciens]|uniref:Ferredoxin-NADP reductase n=1 Tax=Streptomyces melanosporofaciens TaxID=67327 RepID=A0A1H4IC75_STRMJ|nr:Ferredoxin-NADP reductase [Streptomyces melanosporofaciens]